MTPSGSVPTLEGLHVRLRAPKDPDLPGLFEWYNDPETVAPFDRFTLDTYDDFVRSVQEAPSDAQSLAPRFVVELRSGNRNLGFVGHYRAHPVLELTDVWYVLGAKEERGKGYGTEAVGLLIDYLFHAFDLARVGATCDVENTASVRLLDRLGLRREGMLHSALFHHSSWHDVAVYGVTKATWSERARRS